jgi:uncharacterized repeat protein (TIGR03803 family)
MQSFQLPHGCEVLLHVQGNAVPSQRRQPVTNHAQHFTSALLSRLRATAFAVALVFALTSFPVHLAQAQTFTVLHTFSGPDGAYPYAGVTVDGGGNLYGTTPVGGLKDGTVFKLRRSSSGYTLNPLYSFTGYGGPAIPYGGVIFGPDGTLYGTTNEGGAIGLGTVFNMRPPATVCKTALCPWTINQLYAFQGFDGADGGNPEYGEVAFDQAGNIYGTTRNYGPNGDGMVYQLSRSSGGWTENILYNFRGVNGSDGAWPDHNVIFDSSGNLYGTTSSGGLYGGEYGGGTVFRLTPSGSGWTESVIMNFPPPGSNVGVYLQAGLIIDQADNLYGATSFSSGGYEGGSVFELSPSSNGWELTVLYVFTEDNSQGPVGNLVMDNSGNLYGATYAAGAFGWGNVFKLTRSGGGWTYTDLYDFTEGNDGALPSGDLTMDASGNLYGTTQKGGSYGLGVVWEITP